ncbi:cytochrome b [Brackiella oedipodis]|uniref:cytochrome b n=1 Tax=Brackiella oedipodis TaxID=124225 RepID=UPI00048FBA9B|nr:cytochrome b/b6 domain-containing protein [Brackiella oedipodis]
MQTYQVRTYPALTRYLHWTIAILMIYMAGSAVIHFFGIKLEGMMPIHFEIGKIIFVLNILSMIVAACTVSQRPPRYNTVSSLGHLAIKILLFVVPLIMIIRFYGNGGPVDLLGITFIEGTGQKNPAIVSATDGWHVYLGWLLMACVVGHIFMAIKHRVSGSDQDVLPRMATWVKPK